MAHFFISVISVAVILGFLILVHEFGHYAVAKLLGVRVEQFAIGFGKKLLGFRKGETEYRLNILPLGGYVKMSGENPMDQRTGDPREFLSHSRWHRFLIAIAGPSMNILLAIGLLALVFMVHYEYLAVFDEPAVIGWIDQDTPASKAGILTNDRITKINDIQNPTWKQVIKIEALSPNQPISFTFDRGGKPFEKTITPEAFGPSELGSAGWFPKQPNFAITTLEADMPAEKAGLQIGDQVQRVDGQPIYGLEAMVDLLKHTKDKPLEVAVLRDGQPKTFVITPMLKDTDGEKRYRIGIASNPIKVSKLSFTEAMRQSWEQNKQDSLLIIELEKKLVQRKISMKSISGPIGIGQVAGDAARQKGWTPLLETTCRISLNLGLFNLLPIPILDGGVILLLFLESLMRRDISLHIKERIYQAAFVFLVLFAVTVIYNDLAKTLPGMMGRLP
jgi:regulator of sigma E protease